MDPTTAFAPPFIGIMDNSSSSWSSEIDSGSGLFDLMSITDKCPSPLQEQVSQLRYNHMRYGPAVPYSRRRDEMSLVVEVGEIRDIVEVVGIRLDGVLLPWVPELDIDCSQH